MEVIPNNKNKKQKIIIAILVVILIGVVSGIIFSLHKQSQPDISTSTTQATDWEDIYGAKEEQQNAQKYPDRTLPGIVLE